MVRHKSRWLLTHIMTSPEKEGKQASPSTITPIVVEKKHLYQALRSNIDSAFGIAGSAIIEDIQVKYLHTEAQLAIVKVPRDKYKIIRAAMTLVNMIDNQPVVLSVISVNGSARTAKIAGLRTLRQWFQHNNSHSDAKKEGDVRHISDAKLMQLHREMEEIRGMNS